MSICEGILEVRREEAVKFKCAKLAQDKFATVYDSKEEVICPTGGICYGAISAFKNSMASEGSMHRSERHHNASRTITSPKGRKKIDQT